MSQVFDAHSLLGITRKNIPIGVLDSGLLEARFKFFFFHPFAIRYFYQKKKINVLKQILM
jgi:hypothetical protein